MKMSKFWDDPHLPDPLPLKCGKIPEILQSKRVKNDENASKAPKNISTLL